MNNNESISAKQISILFFIFLTGSAIINIPGPLTALAKNGAWISLIISWTIGSLQLGCLLYLNGKFPGLSFIDYGRKTFGNLLTILLALPFISLVLHMASGIVLDMGLFFKSSMMKDTSVYIIHGFIFFLISLTARSGIETMARMFTVLMSITMLAVFVTLLLASYYFHPEFLLPIAPDGIKPILFGTYFTCGFPYSEIFLFSMLLHYVSKEDKKNMNRGMFLALLVNGLCFILVTVCAIMILGPASGNIKFALYQIARLIGIQDIIERIESVIGYALVVGSYMKATLALLVLTLTIARLLKLPDHRILIFPLAFVNLLLSVVLFKGESRWGEVLTNVWPLWNLIANTCPLILLTIVTMIKTNKSH
ncbi:endospore germination permease [Paenibacillus sp. SI8]|uniref:GerAB/ArcD/ProY family transporter n=1 Tax=unclassified Paenibacillus TaxID=185978 RepID=UPI003465A527